MRLGPKELDNHICPAARADEDELVSELSWTSGAAPRIVNAVHDEMRDPHNVRLPHEQLHAALDRVKHSRITADERIASL